MIADPARRDTPTEPRRVHSIEVEYYGGFGVPSVYQAYEQGRGADYRWLFGVPDPDDARMSIDTIERLASIALELGVGLVVMSHINRPAAWRMLASAARRSDGLRHRSEFLRRVRLDDELLVDRSRTGFAHERSSGRLAG